ncbi:MAG: hypothetical protein K8F91_01010, partial [Candidatus Obscuribacterales bacterium]|nr:hypothetical protein [Candidatus Obscuribacterales bacterium]
MKRLTKLAFVLIAFLFGFFRLEIPADTNFSFSGKVTGIADGDTITVVSGQSAFKVRLFGIDCPEKMQPYG